MTNCCIRFCESALLGCLESLELSGTLLFAKAKRSKNFNKVRAYARIISFEILRFAQNDKVNYFAKSMR